MECLTAYELGLKRQPPTSVPCANQRELHPQGRQKD